jgi:site-specific DNA recombinase
MAVAENPLPAIKKSRCAIYCRTSNDERLNQEFNSLDAQREACTAYVVSQKHEGWVLVDDYYEDGGFSGGSLERPALKRLLADIDNGLIDIVVTYKIDRLSRSMRDFMNLVDVFDQHGVTCVSITQAFNTTTSMGRLTLNMLLSFAQFEREQGRDRVRDKFAASRAKGMWMGGPVPLGYVVRNRKLEIEETESATVRMIFERFRSVGSATVLAKKLAGEGVLTKRGRPIDKGSVYQILNNRVYLGLAVHKGTCYPGEHQAIVDQSLWDAAHRVMAISPRSRAKNTRAQTPALLRGLLFAPGGDAMSPTHTRRDGKLYRYYASQSVLKRGAGACPVSRVAAGEIEAVVMEQVRALLTAPEIVTRTFNVARESLQDLTERDVREALSRLDPIWNELFPAEQARIIQSLVERIDLHMDRVQIRFRVDGIAHLAKRVKGGKRKPTDTRELA